MLMRSTKSVLICCAFGLMPQLSTAQGASATDLSSTQACLERGYEKLTRHGIMAAVLDADSERIMKFGAAFEDEIFEIGSVTKTFTANLLAQLVTRGGAKLADPIPSNYQKPGSTITFEELTTHTSGIIPGLFPGFSPKNPLTPYDDLTIPVFKDLYDRTPLAAAPGSAWNYSNIGTSLLGLIMSEIAARPYESMVEDQIFKPLGMSESYFEVPAEKSARFPTGFMVHDNETTQIPHWEMSKSAIDPAGGIRSTIGDMVKYARANLAPASSPISESIELAQKPLYLIRDHNAWIGMNWIIQPDQGLIWHNGETFGFNSILAISTKKHQAVVALTDTTVFRADQNNFDDSLQRVAFDCLSQ